MPLVYCGTDSASARHPTAEVIAAYVDHRLAPEAQAALEAHLADCAECRREVGWVIEVLRRQCALRLQVLPAAGFVGRLVAVSNRMLLIPSSA